MADATSAAKKRNVRIVQALLSVVVVVAIFGFALPKLADFSEVWLAIKAMSWVEVVTLLAISLWNIITYWFVMVASLPGLNYWQAMKVNQTSTAIANTVPAGGALGIGVTYGMLTSYGFSKQAISLSVIVTGVWNNFVKLGMPVVALALLVLMGDAGGALTVAALIGLAMLAAAVGLFALILKSERLARVVGDGLGRLVSNVRRLVRRGPVTGWADAFARFRTQTITLLATRWLALTLATLMSHFSLYTVLLVSLRHVGVSEDEVSWIQVLAAFAFIRLISALPITPGGLGVVELGLTAALIAAGGDREEVVAGVLVYRALTYLLPIPFGVLTYFAWRRGAKRRAAERGETAQSAQVDEPLTETAPRP
ncbi:MAG: lysylphosphatidylglycerol synthase transmembrane domain-containing protein [Actinomycetota bacterium]